MNKNNFFLCQYCGDPVTNRVFQYFSPPKTEIQFKFIEKGKYSREIYRCSLCGHFYSKHSMDSNELYKGGYVDANYEDAEGIRKTYNRIMALDPGKSDNVGRVQCVLAFSDFYYKGLVPPVSPRYVLDVGSGLCVFLSRMKSFGWNCTALDPDLRAKNHAETIVGVPAVCCDFFDFKDNRKFDLITFNRVLEHVIDPVAMLKKAKDFLQADGLIYIEVPDGETAVSFGFDREEFTIDHPNIFSYLSLVFAIKKAGLKPLFIQRIQEPSTKFTLRAFCTVDV